MNTPLEWGAADRYYAARLYDKPEREVMQDFMWKVDVLIAACIVGAVILFLKAWW